MKPALYITAWARTSGWSQSLAAVGSYGRPYERSLSRDSHGGGACSWSRGGRRRLLHSMLHVRRSRSAFGRGRGNGGYLR